MMREKRMPTAPEKEVVETADTTSRYTGDQRLRGFGFRILERPKDGEAVWAMVGSSKTWTQSAAEEYVENKLRSVEVG